MDARQDASTDGAGGQCGNGTDGSGGAGGGAGASGRTLIYQFKPVPYDAAHEFRGAGTDSGVFEEGGPQIAIWLETVHPCGPPPRWRGSFVADIFVTRRTGVYGIGNRPENGMLASSPRSPCGARDNVLPIWAYARGRNYPLLVRQDGEQDTFGGFNPTDSTPENFFCRPQRSVEIIDALTCPTPFFSHDKGKFEPSGRKSLYPPRYDVAASECRVRGSATCTSGCYDDVACTMLRELDDVAAISGATPSPYQISPYQGTWAVPDALPAGDYYVFIEANKQYDQDAPQCPNGTDAECPSFAPQCDSFTRFCERHPTLYDARLPGYGIGANLGQPSVVWATKITIGPGAHVALADDYLGYGDWDHPSGQIYPPDATISRTAGSGAARLARMTDADGTWRFKVTARQP